MKFILLFSMQILEILSNFSSLSRCPRLGTIARFVVFLFFLIISMSDSTELVGIFFRSYVGQRDDASDSSSKEPIMNSPSTCSRGQPSVKPKPELEHLHSICTEDDLKELRDLYIIPDSTRMRRLRSGNT